ncbi:hypothetical protein BB558_000725 [Smittium angustum]|uniref:Uncharacterized protein n=1 Tax=Smittium angustum TaxID=133377 RepID=A0A2U1JDR0_SMIAN|nr:hypothetical protein BB558_000725 [Smittium angustum]
MNEDTDIVDSLKRVISQNGRHNSFKDPKHANPQATKNLGSPQTSKRFSGVSAEPTRNKRDETRNYKSKEASSESTKTMNVSQSSKPVTGFRPNVSSKLYQGMGNNLRSEQNLGGSSPIPASKWGVKPLSRSTGFSKYKNDSDQIKKSTSQPHQKNIRILDRQGSERSKNHPDERKKIVYSLDFMHSLKNSPLVRPTESIKHLVELTISDKPSHSMHTKHSDVKTQAYKSTERRHDSHLDRGHTGPKMTQRYESYNRAMAKDRAYREKRDIQTRGSSSIHDTAYQSTKWRDDNRGFKDSMYDQDQFNENSKMPEWMDYDPSNAEELNFSYGSSMPTIMHDQANMQNQKYSESQALAMESENFKDNMKISDHAADNFELGNNEYMNQPHSFYDGFSVPSGYNEQNAMESRFLRMFGGKTLPNNDSAYVQNSNESVPDSLPEAINDKVDDNNVKKLFKMFGSKVSSTAHGQTPENNVVESSPILSEASGEYRQEPKSPLSQNSDSMKVKLLDFMSAIHKDSQNKNDDELEKPKIVSNTAVVEQKHMDVKQNLPKEQTAKTSINAAFRGIVPTSVLRSNRNKTKPSKFVSRQAENKEVDSNISGDKLENDVEKQNQPKKQPPAQSNLPEWLLALASGKEPKKLEPLNETIKNKMKTDTATNNKQKVNTPNEEKSVGNQTTKSINDDSHDGSLIQKLKSLDIKIERSESSGCEILDTLKSPLTKENKTKHAFKKIGANRDNDPSILKKNSTTSENLNIVHKQTSPFIENTGESSSENVQTGTGATEQQINNTNEGIGGDALHATKDVNTSIHTSEEAIGSIDSGKAESYLQSGQKIMHESQHIYPQMMHVPYYQYPNSQMPIPSNMSINIFHQGMPTVDPLMQQQMMMYAQQMGHPIMGPEMGFGIPAMNSQLMYHSHKQTHGGEMVNPEAQNMMESSLNASQSNFGPPMTLVGVDSDAHFEGNVKGENKSAQVNSRDIGNVDNSDNSKLFKEMGGQELNTTEDKGAQSENQNSQPQEYLQENTNINSGQAANENNLLYLVPDGVKYGNYVPLNPMMIPFNGHPGFDMIPNEFQMLQNMGYPGNPLSVQGMVGPGNVPLGYAPGQHIDYQNFISHQMGPPQFVPGGFYPGAGPEMYHPGMKMGFQGEPQAADEVQGAGVNNLGYGDVSELVSNSSQPTNK